MRLSFVVTPAQLPDRKPAPGSLDGAAVRARFPRADLGFRVVDLDPGEDLAVQLEDFFDREPAPDAEVLFYVSATVVVSVEGEAFVCLDPSAPETGDSVRDLAMVVTERVKGAVSFLVECRHAPDPADPFRSAAVVAAVKDAVASTTTGIELLIAAHPDLGDAAARVSPFTRAALSAIDEADPERGLTTRDLYERLHDREDLLGVVPSFAYVRGKSTLAIVPKREADEALGWDLPASEDPPTVEPPTIDLQKKLPHVVERAYSPSPIPDEAPPSVRKIFDRMDERSVHDDEPTFVDDPPPSSQAGPRSSKVQSVPPTALPANRVFLKSNDDVPRVVIGDRTPSSIPPAILPPVSERPPPSRPPPSGPVSSSSPSSMPPPGDDTMTADEHVRASDARVTASDYEGALVELKRALALMSPADKKPRADVYVRMGKIKRAQSKQREAIANLEKALALVPSHRRALESLLDLDVGEQDWKAVAAVEDRLLGMISDASDRFSKLVEFGERWSNVVRDEARAQKSFERARDIRPDDATVWAKLVPIYDRARALPEALAARRRLAELTNDDDARAEAFADAARFGLLEMKQEDLALELFELALDADPAQIDPLAVVARILAERQEWSELERAYRRMLERAPRIRSEGVRAEVTSELCRRLALLYRDHLDDPELALDAFEDGLDEKPDDVSGHLAAADLARQLNAPERALGHLQAVARLEPARIQTYHALFELFQRTKRPDQAYSAACVTSLAKVADTRERIIFDEHRPDGVPKLARALTPLSWDLLRTSREANLEAVLAAIADAAIAGKLATLAAEKRLPALDPAHRQDPQQSTVSVVRSFSWASHFLAVPAPAIYLNEGARAGLAAVPAEEPTVIAGGPVLRGRSLPELAFLVGRHLAYHVGWHRLLLYFPSIEELSTCFLAGVSVVRRDLPVPAKLKPAVSALAQRIEGSIGDRRGALEEAVREFEKAGSRGDLARLVGDVDRCSARAGFLLAGDLDVARSSMQADQHGVTDLEAKLADLFGFAVSDEHHALREELGVALTP